MAKKKSRKVTCALRTAERQLRELLDLPPEEIPRDAVYNYLKAIAIDPNAKPTAETCRQADLLFERIQQASKFKSSKLHDKRLWCQRLLHAAKRAMHHSGCIMHARNKSHPDFSQIRLQVIESAIETGLFLEHRSPPGSPKMSRLLPMPDLHEYAHADPWAFDPSPITQYVSLRRRKNKEELPVNLDKLSSFHVARQTQDRLELINAVNSRYEITHDEYSEWQARFVGRKQLRPVHCAIFTDDWSLHGRLYTGRYGHQSLRKIERDTIEFSRCPSVELDYGGMHALILYHLLDQPLETDPYALWGKQTTEPLRLMAKTLINVALNAKNRRAAIGQCNLEMSTLTKETDEEGQRVRKTGKALEDGVRLYSAYRKAGVTFEQVYDRALKHHKPIARFFGSDAGIWLMRIDSSIALEVMYHFAKQCIPCLGCHDSFIVPEHHQQELREAMHRHWFNRFGRLPVVKP